MAGEIKDSLMGDVNVRIETCSVPEPNTGCVLWTANSDKNGYGKIYYNKKHWRAHRLSYYLNKGEISESLQVCHQCDTPACINPQHLFLGTNKDNMIDKVKKGRLRNQNINKTHCKFGHEFISENIRWEKTTIGTPRRTCITCYVNGYKMRNSLKKKQGNK